MECQQILVHLTVVLSTNHDSSAINLGVMAELLLQICSSVWALEFPLYLTPNTHLVMVPSHLKLMSAIRTCCESLLSKSMLRSTVSMWNRLAKPSVHSDTPLYSPERRAYKNSYRKLSCNLKVSQNLLLCNCLSNTATSYIASPQFGMYDMKYHTHHLIHSFLIQAHTPTCPVNDVVKPDELYNMWV